MGAQLYTVKAVLFIARLTTYHAYYPADLKSRTMGDGHPSFVHYHDNTSSVAAMNTSAGSPDVEMADNIDGI